MILNFPRLSCVGFSLITALLLGACASDPLEDGLDPFAPTVFKEGATTLPTTPPNKVTLQSFYVSNTTVFKFAIDTDSIRIGNDGVTRYTVVITSPNGNTQAQFEGIRCNSFQWKLYGDFVNGKWRENSLSSWLTIKNNVPNRYQAALAQGALCNLTSQETDINSILQSLNPNGFTGQPKPSNSYGLVD
jgi:hypothetical protein